MIQIDFTNTQYDICLLIMPPTLEKLKGHIAFGLSVSASVRQFVRYKIYQDTVLKGSLTLAMGKCLWFSVKIKVVDCPFLHLEATLTWVLNGSEIHFRY